MLQKYTRYEVLISIGKLFIFLICAFLALFSASSQSSNQDKVPFVSGSSVERTKTQIGKLPKDDIWWNVYGEDQAWNFKNVFRFHPTVLIHRDGPVSELINQKIPAIPLTKVETPSGRMSLEQFLDDDQSLTMSLVILHSGDIVYEYYKNQEPYEKAIYWSVTKIIVSTLIGILEDRNLLNLKTPVGFYIEELKDSPYANVSIENLMNMADGLDCGDDYFDKNSCYYRYSVAIGDGYWTDSSPSDPYDFVSKLKVERIAKQGKSYQYSGVNTFILGWVIEQILDMPLQDAITKEIWMKIGAESDGLMLAPRFGVPIMHGGLIARPRDAARVGLLFTPSYKKVNEKRVISDRFISNIKNSKLHLSQTGAPYIQVSEKQSHSAYHWDSIFANGDFFKGGWAGQGFLVNPEKDIVAVYTGYAKDPIESQPNFLPILREMLNKVFPDS